MLTRNQNEFLSNIIFKWFTILEDTKNIKEIMWVDFSKMFGQVLYDNILNLIQRCGLENTWVDFYLAE